MPIRNAVQSMSAGIYSIADKQILMAKIYNIWYFIVKQPGADRIDSALVAGGKQYEDNRKQQDRSPDLER